MIGAVPGRGAGTFVNPNAAAALIVMGTMIALPFVPMRLRSILLVAALVGIAPTSSRSGFLYAGVMIIGAMCLRLLNRAQVLVLAVALPVLIALTAVYYDKLMEASDVTRLDQIVLRLAWFDDVEEEDGSVASRKMAAAHARDMFLEKPVTGHGLGSTSLESLADSPHNMYLMLAAEQGVLGLALYVFLIAIMYLRGRGVARAAATREEHDIGKTLMLYALFLAAQGFFSHNVLEEPHGIFAIAFLAAAAHAAERRRFLLDAAYPQPGAAGRALRDVPARRKAAALAMRTRQGGAPGRT
jgi:O-antigen ligase